MFGRLFAKLIPKKIGDEEKVDGVQASTVSGIHDGDYQRGNTYLPNTTTHHGSSIAPSSR